MAEIVQHSPIIGGRIMRLPSILFVGQRTCSFHHKARKMHIHRLHMFLTLWSVLFASYILRVRDPRRLLTGTVQLAPLVIAKISSWDALRDQRRSVRLMSHVCILA